MQKHMKGVIFGEVIRASEYLCYFHTVLPKEAELLDAATIQTRIKSAFVFVKYFPKSKNSKSCFHTLI